MNKNKLFFFVENMSNFKACTLTIILSTLIFPQASKAVILTPTPSKTQVKEVSRWFTGLFDNSQQIASNPTVPFISMSNCEVQVANGSTEPNTKTIFLEQKSPAFQRTRFYSFSQGTDGVNLSIRSFLNANILGGLCNRPESERVVSVNNISTVACNLLLTWEPQRYVGNNQPNGCPTSTGGKVVSNVAILANAVESLDQIFDARGNLLAGTTIQFQRVNIPESSLNLAILAVGIGFTFKAVTRKLA